MKHDTPEFAAIAERGTILRCQVGSGLHGTAVDGQDDRDEMGLCVEPAEYVSGLRRFEQYVFRSQPDRAWADQWLVRAYDSAWQAA
ncbi:nucleotidyltransferase domain-containing protein [Amycolatopsis sp. NPDC051371]|uniref:DNA polymerase beta superfamily protein n=1 Tax=Amycolatopsis sp. NPDC051371 TaxID=3155800 RepID=UPI0034180B89